LLKTRTLRFLYLTRFSKPAVDRAVYQVIHRKRVRRIVEIGIGTGQRAARMIEVARLQFPASQVHYTGVDLFEGRSRSDRPGLSLKAAHRLLSQTGARVVLLPGDPFSALSRAANTLGGSQLVVISAGHAADSLRRAWFYLPRILAEDAPVLIERPRAPAGEMSFRVVSRKEIEKRSQAASLRRAA
jgi:hypothetical protein